MADASAGASPLAEVDPHSLDELWARVDRKLVAGLPQDVTDADIDAITLRLRAQRDRFVQDQIEAANKPRAARKPAAKSVAEITIEF